MSQKVAAERPDHPVAARSALALEGRALGAAMLLPARPGADRTRCLTLSLTRGLGVCGCSRQLSCMREHPLSHLSPRLVFPAAGRVGAAGRRQRHHPGGPLLGAQQLGRSQVRGQWGRLRHLHWHPPACLGHALLHAIPLARWAPARKGCCPVFPLLPLPAMRGRSSAPGHPAWLAASQRSLDAAVHRLHPLPAAPPRLQGVRGRAAPAPPHPHRQRGRRRPAPCHRRPLCRPYGPLCRPLPPAQLLPQKAGCL